MPTDYGDAAERHWEDAEHLLADNRFANADHLFGLSAECALKSVMLRLGMALQVDGAPQERKHRVHIDRLWDEFVTFANNRNCAKYAAGISGGSNPFCKWNVAQRYCHRSQITQVIVETHKRGAQTTRAVLNEAILDGV